MNRTDYGSYVHPDDPGEPATGAPRISVTDDEASLLKFLAEGRGVVEIGTGLGISTRALAQYASYVYTVDNDPWVWDNIWPTFADCPTIYTVKDWADAALSPNPIDFVFIDGEHATEDTRYDLKAACVLLDRGMIVVHDTNMDTVRAALADYDWHQIPTYHGMGIIYRGWDR